MQNDRMLKGWLPVELKLGGSSASANWMEFGSRRLAQPFFEDTVLNLRCGFPPPKEAPTDLQEIVEIASKLQPAAPDGLIFHISRCGSTLLANALRAKDETVVVSEADPITKLLAPDVLYTADDWGCVRAKLIKALMTLFAQYRTGRKEHLIVKFVSWNILSWTVVRALWPDAPCVVLIRDPVEVLISNLTMSTGWMKRKDYPLDDASRPIPEISEEEYGARVIGKMCEAAFQLCGEKCRILDYQNLSATTIRDAAAFLGVALRDDDRLTQVLRVDAKDPRQRRPFLGDREKKQQAATDSMRSAVIQWAAEPYARARARESK